jgi:multidrug efflux pump subunit AcrB
MTFIPLLGYYLLRRPGKPEPTIQEKRERGFYGAYYRAAGFTIRHRWGVLIGSIMFLVAGGLAATRLKSQFFPEDVQYWSYVDVWLPNDAPLSLTNETAERAEETIRRVVEGREHGLLTSLTTFAGGGGPRFWFSVSPEQQQKNYAQILPQVRDKEMTPELRKRLGTQGPLPESASPPDRIPLCPTSIPCSSYVRVLAFLVQCAF